MLHSYTALTIDDPPKESYSHLMVSQILRSLRTVAIQPQRVILHPSTRLKYEEVNAA